MSNNFVEFSIKSETYLLNDGPYIFYHNSEVFNIFMLLFNLICITFANIVQHYKHYSSSLKNNYLIHSFFASISLETSFSNLCGYLELY